MGEMSKMPEPSITDKARKLIADGYIKECIDMLGTDLKRSSLSDPFFYNIQNDLIQLRSRFARLEREKKGHTIEYEDYDLKCNNISDAVLEILEKLDIEIGQSSPEQLKFDTGHLYKVELVLDMDFVNSTDEEIKVILKKIATILKTRPNELKIITKKVGSIIIETEVSAEALVKLKSLAKAKIVNKLKDVRVLEKGWEWMDKEDFVLFLAEVDIFDVDFRRTNLRDAYLLIAYFRGADLSRIDLSRADLRCAIFENVTFKDAILEEAVLEDAILKSVDFSRTNFRGANLSSTNLSNANLSDTNLSMTNLSWTRASEANLTGADLSGADLNSAYLINANLSGANLSGANLSGANFHIDQATVLEKMDVDISKVIFVDDYGRKVKTMQ